jgi:hypothetical protein
MARLSSRAYLPFDSDERSFEEFSAALARLGLTNCIGLIDRDVGTAGFVVAGDDMIAVVFRGTQDELDWRTNVNASWIVLQGGVRVHTGFFQAYWPIRETLFATVQRWVEDRPRPVYVTGHSLGAALATMATAELANHDNALVRDSIAACYTFGSPRVGDATFDQFVKVPLYRVANGIDIVPTVPLALMGYRHVGDIRYFGTRGTAPLRRALNPFRWTWRTLRGLAAVLRSRKLVNIEDHLIPAYIDKLAAWAQENALQTQARRAATADPKL